MTENEESNAGDKSSRWDVSRRRFLKGAAIGTGVVAADLSLSGGLAGAATNTITTENAKLGTAASDWDIDNFDESIEGFATEYSVNAGQTVTFKIKTDSKKYQIRIFRMGWYNGLGARLITTIPKTLTTAQAQPAPISDPVSGIVDCGNWGASATWAVPSNAVSGVYVANLERLDAQGGDNRIMFVVRNDGRAAKIMLQTSDTTYQAYNTWGGNSLYTGTANYGRAVKVSYNRPMRGSEIENNFFYGEYPLVRWLERNGYDVTYCGDIDTHRSGSQLLNKKVFISSGHDEYWSGAQRANVEAAIAAGVNVAFLTGNECFWRIRFENSVDGQNTPNKTIVCYKETLESAKIDPSTEWTGTWRDPRFSTPTNGGGRPENALTGTFFRAIDNLTDPDFPIEVPYAYRRHRLWRNTSIANLTAGTKATLAAATLGYEWNTDADNGFRPAGLIRLSETTQTAPQVLQDYGATYIQAPLTHYTTMYKAPSGARVFSSGSCQWNFGLDEYHLTNPEVTIPADSRMQQATMNLLADMGAQPASKQSNLVAAAASTDTLPPVSTIVSPAVGAIVPIGSPVVISGTSVDSGGGVVAGVEVSVDNGTTWHPATGTSAWSYSFVPTALGSITIKVRAVDDSCNLEKTGPTRSITGGQRTAPCSIWPAGTLPAVADSNDAGAIEAGVRFRTQTDGFIKAIRFYKGAGNTGTHVGHLWSNTGALLGTATFSGETATGWQQASLTTPVAVSAGVTYVASYFAPVGHYSADADYFNTSFDLAPLTALANGVDGANGVYRYGSSGFPTQTYGAANYWVDVVFDTDDQLAPTVVERSPNVNIQAVGISTTVSAVFSEAMLPSSIVIELRDPANALMAGAVSYIATERRGVFTPSAPLNAATVYTAKVVAAKDASGHNMAASTSWSFTTASPIGGYPASLWTSASVPATLVNADPNPVELGLRFTSDADALVTAIRFYKDPANSGTHTGHLWSVSGAMLAAVAFTSESASGWQQANLSVPVAITKNTGYVVSYHTTSGFYPSTAGFFGSDYDRAPLHAAATGSSGNENGLYLYTATGGFPINTWNGTNYWVDLVTVRPPDNAAPTVVDYAPAAGLEVVDPAEPITASFSEALNPATLVFTLQGPGNTPVSAIVGYDANLLVATLTPVAGLAAGTTYSVSVTTKDLAGNQMASPLAWSFTTAPSAGAYPVTLWPTSAIPDAPSANDPGSVEVGVKIRSDIDGRITGIRFYKGDGNTGSHVGHLWSSAGDLLGSAVFTNETATGWQQAKFSTPIPITAGLTYVASYLAPNGHYAATSGGMVAGINSPPLRALGDGVDGGNGVYAYGPGSFPTGTYGSANYWVDVIFVSP